MDLTSSTHLHITGWALAIILFFITYALIQAGNQKGGKIVHMILRLIYILVVVTGFMLFYSAISEIEYILKAIAGIWVIASMEMILGRKSRDQKTTSAWIQLAIALLVTLYLGLSLPLGFQPLG